MTIEQYFKSISEKKFLGVSDGTILSWCPSMDLLTISMNKTSLWVYRLNGQRVYSVNNKSVITGITWKPDGKSFGLIGADGQCKVYDSNTGKLVVILNQKESSLTKDTIQSVNWCHRKGVLFSENKFDKLFDFDISKSLPKLPPLQNSSAADYLFTTKLAVDDIAQSDESIVDFLLLCFNSSKISITLYGLFTINDIEVFKPSEKMEFITQASTKSLEEHFFVVNNEGILSLVQLHATFTSKFGNYSPEVTLASSKILAILGYIRESVSFLTSDCKAFPELLGKYLETLKDSLVQSVEGDMSDEMRREALLSNLYDLLLTGTLSDNMKDFLTNQLGERGVKRLSKVGNSCFDGIRRTCFYHLITSIERMIVVLNTLKGLAEWEERGKPLGLDPEFIKSAIKSASELLRTVYKFIWKINDEQKLFNSFVEWLGFSIEEILSEEDSKKVFKGKVSDLTLYFTSYLTDSTISHYLDLDIKSLKSSEANMYVSECERNPNKTLLTDLFQNLNDNCHNGFRSIEESMKRQIKVDTPGFISSFEGDVSVHMKIIDGFGYIICFTENTLEIHKFDIKDAFNLSKITIGEPGFKFHNVQFIDDEEVIVLGNLGHVSKLIAFNFRTLDFANKVSTRSFSDIKIKERNFSDSFKPKYLAVNGNKGRRIGCILAENRQTYTFFDLDNSSNNSEEEDDEMLED